MSNLLKRKRLKQFHSSYSHPRKKKHRDQTNQENKRALQKNAKILKKLSQTDELEKLICEQLTPTKNYTDVNQKIILTDIEKANQKNYMELQKES